MSTLIYIVVVLIIVGLVLYLVNRFITDANIKMIIHILVVLIVILWLLNLIGLLKWK